MILHPSDDPNVSADYSLMDIEEEIEREELGVASARARRPQPRTTRAAKPSKLAQTAINAKSRDEVPTISTAIKGVMQ